VDYFRIFNAKESKVPVVVIPGFGGSWDELAILTGTEGNNWKIPDYVKVYDGLKQSTIDAGYEEGKDLFVFAYDWRKPLDQLADDLKSFLEEKNLDEKKSNFIGHSMGGLVARAYAQKYGLEKVNKIITAGSPHEGTLEAYNIWEGASVWGDVWWEKVLLETQAQLHRKPGETKIDAIRRIAPSVKDLLPTTDYIAKNGELQPWDSLKQKNQYLKNLNGASAVVNEILLPLWSSDEQTRAVVNAEKPSTYEKLFGLWEDGKPAYADPYEFQPGDGTVIKNSAKGPFTTEIPGNGSHANLVAHDQNIRKIFESLGLATDDIVGGSTTSEQNALVAVLQSPGTITVCNADESSCNLSGGVSLADGKLYFLPGYDGSKVVVKVIANETGKYKLHLGNITSNGQWETVTGDLKNIGQTDKFTVEGGSVNVVGDDLTSARYLLEAKKKLNEYSPKWDTKGNIELLADQTAAMNRRILSATTLRVSLRDEYKKAKRTTNYEYFENAIDMWNAIDQVMETILASSPLPNSLNGAGVNKQLSEPKQKLSYFGSALAALALDRSSESKEVSNSKMWVKLDKQIQADILMGYALQIK
ncbi:MAG: Lipase transmembrane protein, partial [Microgenomates group bacterium GW2011_GWC1_44_9]